jgi:hypothetical protein
MKIGNANLELSDTQEVPPSNFSAEGTSFILDISKPVSPPLNEAGSPPPASLFKPKTVILRQEVNNA